MLSFCEDSIKTMRAMMVAIDDINSHTYHHIFNLLVYMSVCRSQIAISIEGGGSNNGTCNASGVVVVAAVLINEDRAEICTCMQKMSEL